MKTTDNKFLLYTAHAWRNGEAPIESFDSEQSAWNHARQLVKPHECGGYSIESTVRANYRVAQTTEAVQS